MNSVHRSILTRALMAGVASLAFVLVSAGGVRAEIVIGAEGAPGTNCDLSNPVCMGGNAGDGESVSAFSNPALAIGGEGGVVGLSGDFVDNGNGGAGGSASAFATGSSGNANVAVSASATGGNGSGSPDSELGGAGGNADAQSTATSLGSGAASSSANATGGNPGGCDNCFSGVGGDADAISAATSTGPGAVSSSAVATGGLGISDGGNANANSLVRSGGGMATAKAVATGNSFFGVSGGAGNATSNATTAEGALAQAQSTALGSSGQAQSSAKTGFGGVSVQSSALAPTDGDTATANAIAQGGSGQAFVNPGQTAYAFSTALPDKAYATTLIGGASHVASALLGPRDQVFGTAILGANYASDGGGESNTYSASSTFDFGYGGDLQLGLIDDQVTGSANGLGFQSMEFTIQADGVDVLDVTFGSLAVAESFFRDDVIDLGSALGPNIDLTFGYTLIADGPGGFGFDFAIGGAVPEPSTWAMMLVGFAGLGLAGWRGSRNTAAHAA